MFENCPSVRDIAGLCIIEPLDKPAGVVQWQYRSFPSFGRGFDSHRPLHKSRYLVARSQVVKTANHSGETMISKIFQDKTVLAVAAAEQASSAIRRAIQERNLARIIVATGNSQLEF